MEIELKLLLDQEGCRKLREHPLIERLKAGGPEHRDLLAIYFDTPDFLFRKHDAGLRVRQSNGQWMQTMKAGGSVQGGLHQRHEWEGPADGSRPDLGRLRALVGPGTEWSSLLATQSLDERLQELFAVKVGRLAWDLRMGETDIELVLDEGTIERDGRQDPVSEIELELKSGDPAGLFELALRLLDDIPMRLGNRSKAERGYALCKPPSRGVVKAEPPRLAREASVEQGLQAILDNCLAQIQGNEDGVIEGEDPECLHQMRVGIRRLRSALKLFEPAVHCPASLSDELEWLGGELGAARDWEVLASATLARLEEAPAGAEQLAALRDAMPAIVNERRRQAAQVLMSPRYARLRLSLLAWLLGAKWREDADLDRLRLLDSPLRDFADATLARNVQRMHKRGKRLRKASPEALHRLRIACKKSRYALEFFQSLYRPRRVRRYLAALSRLQDELGWRNDLAVADGLLRQLQSTHPQLGAAPAFARGYMASQGRTGQRALRRGWKTLRALKMPRLA